MRLKFDENLPRSAASRVAALGFDVDTVLDESLGGHSDDTVWAAAQREQRLLVTQDLDFADMRRFVPGTHAGVLIVRLPDSEQWRVADYAHSPVHNPHRVDHPLARRRFTRDRARTYHPIMRAESACSNR